MLVWKQSAPRMQVDIDGLMRDLNAQRASQPNRDRSLCCAACTEAVVDGVHRLPSGASVVVGS